MKTLPTNAALLLLPVVSLMAPAPALGQELEAEVAGDEALLAPDPDESALGTTSSEGEQGWKEEASSSNFGWQMAGGRYTDPTSLFSLHGYVDGVFASASPDWKASDPTQLAAPGQLLVPNTAQSSFQFDAALIFNSEPTDIHRIMLEAHLVSDPSGTGAAGPGGVTMAITEATVAWDILGHYLTVASGVFWAPFGIVSEDWLGAQSRFTLVPRAAGAFPAHYNERGVRLNGSVAFSEGFGVNYVASIGNGVQSFGIDGQSPFDANSSRSLIARLGLFPGLGSALEIGYSVHRGRLRDALDLERSPDDSQRYESSVFAHGLDAHLRLGAAEFRGYYIRSTETLGGDADRAPPALLREGAMFEAMYDFEFGNDWVAGLSPKARIDGIRLDTLEAEGDGTLQGTTLVYSVGFNFYPGGQALAFNAYPQRNIYLSFEYHIQQERTGPELDNDRFVARFTGRF